MELDLDWNERGPPPPSAGGPLYWRSQRWREGTEGGAQRYANRGGRNREWWTGMFQAKAQGPAFLQAWLLANPRPDRKGGKGGKGGGEGSGARSSR